MNIFLARALAFFPIVLLLTVPAARAQTLPSGTYRCTAELGAVLLDGRYPLQIDEMPGTIEVTTSAAGVLSGHAFLFGQPLDITGTIKERQTYIRVALRGRLQNKRFLLTATLQGGQFAGTLRLGKLRTPCRFDASATGPARVTYTLALTVAANGAITGPGTLFAARQEIPVTVRGRVRAGRASLSIKGGKTSLTTSTGQLDAGGITASKWTGQGFGALTQGASLRITPAVP